VKKRKLEIHKTIHPSLPTGLSIELVKVLAGILVMRRLREARLLSIGWKGLIRLKEVIAISNH